MVAVLTALSRVLGLVREMFQSRLIGAGVEQSAFAVAFAIPNMARRMFGEGALTAAFVPVFRGELEADETLARARRLARAVMTMSLLMLAAGVVLVWVAVSGALWWTEGTGLLSPKWTLTLRDVRILIPYMLFICGAAFGMGVLNTFGKFAAAALMPSILNLVWIAALATLFFVPGLDVQTRVSAVCGAILFAGFLQMGFLLRAMAKKGIPPWPSLAGWRDENVRLVWRNMAIGCAGAGAVQINYMLDQVLALKASDWAAGAIGYADRLMELPLGIVGTAFGTVLLPTLAGFFARGDQEGARDAFVSSVRNMLLVVLPAAVGLVVLAPELTRLIYQGGRFDELAVVRVSRAVACYSLGLAFFCVQKTLTPWFQAQKDLKTPLKVMVRMVFLNAALNIAAVFGLPEEWRHVGLAASTVICAGISCVWLAVEARRMSGPLGWGRLLRSIGLMLIASAAMAGVLVALKRAPADFGLGGRIGEIVAMAVFVGTGAAVYFGVMLVGGRDILWGLVNDFRGRRRR
ncbi:MAG: murein biosynthesis integral membrane protein MurJ [Kiritimatiellia bacterium]